MEFLFYIYIYEWDINGIYSPFLKKLGKNMIYEPYGYSMKIYQFSSIRKLST